MAAARAKVVLVDDDEHIRAMVERMLSSGGYEVVSTSAPAIAAELVRTEKPDLVLLDISMPGMDGYQVLKALQADPATAGCPAVFLTGHRDFAERVKAFREGIVDFVPKPFSREILLKKVQRVLDKAARQRHTGAAEPARRFDELDDANADLLVHDPPALRGSPTDMPSFEDVPEAMREVLVVDDNEPFRRFLRDLLVARGFNVEEAADGEEGLSLALSRKPALIISDVRMPGGDGLEFCRRVRAHSLLRQTPLLFLSGWDDYKRRYEGLELGADDFLSKDTSIRELLIRIQLLMKRYADLAGRRGAGMTGDIEVVGAPGVLQMCHLTRLTGVLEADGPGQARVRFRAGDIVGAECGEATGEEAVFAFLGWERGRFRFLPGETEGAPLGVKFEQLLLEGCRRLDETRRTT